MESLPPRIVLIVGLVLLVLIAAGFVAGHFFYTIALNPKADRAVVFGAPHNANTGGDEARRNRGQYEAWWATVSPEDAYIQSADGLRLHSYCARAGTSSDKWVIAVHGYTGNGTQMLAAGKAFYERGYNVLLPDCRGHGQSEGEAIGMGWLDRKDMVAWVGHILGENPKAQIVLFGISMGGATVMMTAGEDLPANVRAIVEDCGYTSVWEEFAYQMKAIFNLPAFPVMHFASAVARVRAGYTLQEASAIAQVAKSKTPMLFIHGEEDTFVPYDMLKALYDACPSEKAWYSVPEAGHGEAWVVAGDEYWNRVFSFLDDYIEPSL